MLKQTNITTNILITIFIINYFIQKTCSNKKPINIKIIPILYNPSILYLPLDNSLMTTFANINAMPIHIVHPIVASI